MTTKKQASLFRAFGPGLVLAAAGIGVGDLVLSATAGARLGFACAWAVALGASLKLALSDAMARWQLEHGETVLEAGARRAPRWLVVLALGYFALWATLAAAMLLAACGLAASALVPAVPRGAWAIAHAAAGAWLVDKSRYSGFERALGLFVAIMVFAIVGTAAWSVFAGFTPWRGEILPRASDAQWCLGLIGGIGGSVTLLAHGYWMRSHGWSDFRFARAARIDLAVGYGVTALFGIASMLLAASIFAPHTILRGDGAPLQLAQMLKLRLGTVGVALYLVGMWATALAAWLGTLQSVPQLLGGFLDAREWRPRALDTRSFQRACFVFLCVVPLPLVLVGEPVSLVVAFAILASFVLPGLSAGMLVLGGRRPPWGKLTTIALVAALALFCVLSVASLSR